MARIDDLISEVQDERVQRGLRDAVSQLRQNKRFGIVFEEHIPEITALLNHPIRPGVNVQLRMQLGGDTYRVDELLPRGKVRIVSGSVSEVVRAKDIAVVKRFGEAVYPALRPVGNAVTRAPGKPHHAVINGENYNALQTLLYLYEGQVDCVYIDPPYNTGARDWKYNNRYVDETDTWHHSKWLSFMAKRLHLTRRLLSADGVLIVTIDEHEVHHLGMLLERVFPSHDRHLVTIVHNPKGTFKRNFARVNEYAFFCVPKVEGDVINPLVRGMFDQVGTPEDMAQISLDEEDETPEDLYLRRRGQESGFRHQRPNQFYAILDERTKKVGRYWTGAGQGRPLRAEPTWLGSRCLSPGFQEP